MKADDWIEGGAGFDTLAGDNSELFFNSSIHRPRRAVRPGRRNRLRRRIGRRHHGRPAPACSATKACSASTGASARARTPACSHRPATMRSSPPIPTTSCATASIMSRPCRGTSITTSSTATTAATSCRGTVTTDATADGNFVNDILTQEGIDRIAGFNDVVRRRAQDAVRRRPIRWSAAREAATSFRDGNILIGGDGSDTLQRSRRVRPARRRRLSQRADRHQHRRGLLFG